MNLQGRETIGYLHFLKASIGKSNPILTDSQFWRRRGRCRPLDLYSKRHPIG